MGNYASVGDSYTKGESDQNYPSKTVFNNAINSRYTKTESDSRFQPKGTYATLSDIENTVKSIPSIDNIYTKTESDGRYPEKTVFDAAIKAGNEGLAARYTKTESDTIFQPKGNYALVGASYTKAESDGRYPALATYNAAIKSVNDGLVDRYTKGQSDTTFATKTDLNNAATSATNTFETKTRVQSLVSTNTLNDVKPKTMWCADGGICDIPVDNSNASTIRNNKGRLHISGNELLYLLNKNGVIIGKEWGGNGNLQVQGNLFFKDPNHGMRYHNDPDGPFVHGWNGGSLGTVEGGERQALRWDSNRNVVLPGKNLYLGDWRIEDADELRFIHKGDLKMAIRSNGQIWAKDNFFSQRWNKWL